MFSEEHRMIHRNQLRAAGQLIGGMRRKHRSSILNAQMQVGKSGTYLYAACLAIFTRLVKNVVIVTGNSQTDLHLQCQNDKDEYISTFIRTVNKRCKHDASSLHQRLDKSIRIIWGTELNKVKQLDNGTLIIWEESHFAQSMGNRPSKFFQRFRIPMNGDESYLIKKDCFVISVSATPMSEVSANIHLLQKKNIVFLKPGKGYRGVEWYYTRDKIRPIDDLVQTVDRVMSRWVSKSPRYHLIRIAEKKQHIITTLAAKYGMAVKEYSSAKTDRQIKGLKSLETEPECHTIILLKGMCRMGNVVPKQHIGFVMETANLIQTDTCLQGLLGRMCGYKDGKYGYNGNDDIEIYVPRCMFKAKEGEKNEIELYIQMANKMNIIPHRAMNIIPGKKNKIPVFTEGPNKGMIAYNGIPIFIPESAIFIDDSEYTGIMAHQAKPDKKIIGYIAEYLIRNPEAVEQFNNAEQSAEFWKIWDGGKNISKRNLFGDSYINNGEFNRVVNAWRQKNEDLLGNYFSAIDQVQVCYFGAPEIKTKINKKGEEITVGLKYKTVQGTEPAGFLLLFHTANASDEQKEKMKKRGVAKASKNAVFMNTLMDGGNDCVMNKVGHSVQRIIQMLSGDIEEVNALMKSVFPTSEVCEGFYLAHREMGLQDFKTTLSQLETDYHVKFEYNILKEREVKDGESYTVFDKIMWKSIAQ